MSIVLDLLNHLADMPGLVLPIFPMAWPSDPVNCVALFPTSGGVQGNIGIGPGHYSYQGGIGSFDYPGVQVQVRGIDPYQAYSICEDIRVWIDENEIPGYLLTHTYRSHPDDLTNDSDLTMIGGPAYRFACEFGFTKVRS